MKNKKTWLIVGIVALFTSSFAALNGLSEQTYKPAQAAEKEIIYFNINSSGAYNQNIIILNVDVDLPHTNVNLPVLYNGNYTNFWFNYSSETNIWLTWSGHYPLGTTQYQHYRIDAGTVYYENSTTKYVLRHDYNLWWTGHSGGGANIDMVKQENVPSFRITGYDGQRIDNGYWHMQFTYEKEANAKSINTWNAAPFYESEANDEFTLYDWNTKDVNGNICHGADTLNTSETSGNWYVRIPHGIFTDAADGQDDKCRSFWFPKGTLFGGYNGGYSIYLENDVYFDHDGQHFNYEIYSTSVKDRVYDPLDAFRTSLKMDDPAFDGDGTGACASLYPAIKSTWNAFSTYQKKAFVNTDYYASAFARLQAWVTANGDVLNGTSYVISANNMAALPISKNKENTIVIVVASMIMISSIGLFMFIKRKKYSK